MTRTPGSNPPDSLETGEASGWVERANEDPQLEGLEVLPLQDVEQIGRDMVNNHTAGKAGIKKRMVSRGTLCASRACLRRLEERVKILRCEVSEEASLPRGWRGWEQGKHAGVLVI